MQGLVTHARPMTLTSVFSLPVVLCGLGRRWRTGGWDEAWSANTRGRSSCGDAAGCERGVLNSSFLTSSLVPGSGVPRPLSPAAVRAACGVGVTARHPQGGGRVPLHPPPPTVGLAVVLPPCLGGLCLGDTGGPGHEASPLETASASVCQGLPLRLHMKEPQRGQVPGTSVGRGGLETSSAEAAAIATPGGGGAGAQPLSTCPLVSPGHCPGT